MEKRFLNIRELSKELGLGIATLNKLVKSGEIPSHKIRKRRLFDWEEIVEWVKSHSGQGEGA